MAIIMNRAIMALALVAIVAAPAPAQRRATRFETRPMPRSVHVDWIAAEDTATASSGLERILFGALVGTAVLSAGGAAFLNAPEDEFAVVALVLPPLYAAGVTGGVTIATAGAEGARPAATARGALLGAAPLLLVPLFLNPSIAVVAAGAAWVLSPVLASHAHANW